MLNTGNQRMFWLAAGIASGMLHLIGMSQALGGILLTYLPTLPLLIAGMSLGVPSLGLAVTAGMVTSLLTFSPGATMFYFLFHAFPSLLFIRRYLHPGIPPFVIRPVTRILAELTLVMVALFVLGCLAAAGGETGTESIEAQIAVPIGEALKGFPEPYRENAQQFVLSYAFLIPACVFWMWGAAFLGMAYAAHLISASYRLAIRPFFVLASGVLPGYFLAALVSAGAASLAAEGDAAFMAKASLVMLLFPYCICGVRRLHASLNGMRSKPLLLSSFYILSLLSAWPVIAVAFVEIIRQIKAFFKPTIRES